MSAPAAERTGEVYPKKSKGEKQMDQRKPKRIFAISLAALAVFDGFSQQQTKPAYLFRTVLSTGGTVGGHRLSPTATFEGLAFNDAAEVAFVIHWIDADWERSAVFTLNRRIAIAGDVIDGKPVTRILPAALAINNAGQVAFEASYGNPTQIGIFVNRKFIMALSVSGSPNDFTLTDDGKITLKDATAAAPTTTAAKNVPWLPTGLWARLPAPIQRKINSNPTVPIYIDPNIPVQRGGPVYPQRAPQSPQSAQAKSAPTPPAKACALPEFPIPAEWVAIGTDMKGPIASHIFDAPAKARVYESRFFGPMGSPFRVIQFSADCKPLLIVIGDNFLKGRFEMWTPNGLFSRTLPDGGGFLDLNGFAGRVLPDRLVRENTPLKINRHGQVLVPVSFDPDGYAIILGTPVGGPH
jgi:hypothetical protein